MLTEHHMRKLWQHMTEIYGNHWTSQHGDCDTNNTWRKGLTGITPQMLGRGIMRCLMRANKNEWPPTLPMFRNMCLDLPDIERSIKLALDNQRTNDEFILHMRRLIGSWELRHKSYKELEQLARMAYEQAAQHVIELSEQKVLTNGKVLR